MNMATVLKFYMVNESFDRESWTVARFSTMSAAEEYAKKSPYYSYSKNPQTITVFDSVADLEQSRTVSARDAALAKLTPEDRAALGV